VRAANVVRLGQVEALSIALLRNSKWANGDLSLSLSLFLFVSVCLGVYCVIEGCNGGSKKPQC
jgi:hypothetical protein